MRLTKYDRDTIIQKAIAHRFEKQDADMKKREEKLAIAAYNSIYDEAVRKAVAKLPKGWLRIDGCLRFNANGYQVSLTLEAGLPVPYSSGCGNNGNLTGSIAAEVQQFAVDKDSGRNAQQSARRQLSAILESLNTLAQLKESWPEGKAFYAYLDKAEKRPGLPSVRFEDVNKLLGLKETA